MKLFLVCAFLLSPLFAFAEIWDATPLNYQTKNFHQGTYYSEVAKSEKIFIVRLPKKYVSGETVDLLYYLPGGLGNAVGMPIELHKLNAYLDSPLFDHVLFVAPDAGNYGLWSDTPRFQNTQMVLELIQYIEKNVPHNVGRKLVGHSLGGAGAMHFAFDHGDMFDAIGSISPAILMWSPFEATDTKISEYIREHAPTISFDYLKATITGIMNSFADAHYWDKFDFYTRIKTKKLPKCFGIFTGAQDSLGFDYQARKFVAHAKDFDVEIFYSEDPERDHAVGKAILDVAEFFESCGK